MKKTYMIPELEILQYETQQMLAASVGISSDPKDIISDISDVDARDLDLFEIGDSFEGGF